MALCSSIQYRASFLYLYRIRNSPGRSVFEASYMCRSGLREVPSKMKTHLIRMSKQKWLPRLWTFNAQFSNPYEDVEDHSIAAATHKWKCILGITSYTREKAVSHHRTFSMQTFIVWM